MTMSADGGESEPKRAAAPDSINLWADYYSSDSITRTMNLILRPASLISRIIERLEFDDDILRRHVTLELASGPGPHIVPIAEPLRGELIDMLTIESGDSVTAATLSRRDTAILSKRLLELVAEGLGLNSDDAIVNSFTDVGFMSPEESRTLNTMLRRAAELIHDENQLSNEDLFNALGESLFKLASSKDFYQLYRFFRRHRLLLVPCQPKSPFVKISYSYEVGSREFRRRSSIERARSVLGLSAYSLLLEVPLSLKAPSYHLRMRAPMNHYTRKCVLASTNRVRTSDDKVGHWARRPYVPQGSAGFVQYSTADADGLVHVYTGDLHTDPSKPRRLFVGVRIAERPFGQVGAAFVRLVIVGAMIAAMRVLGQDIVGGQSALAISIFLALPGLLGASALFGAQLGSIHAPITARVGSLVAAGFSILASVFFLMWIARYSNCISAKYPDCARTPSDNISMAIEILLAIVSACALVCLVHATINYIFYRIASRARPRTLPLSTPS
jgi:hypothetical protein